MSRYQNFPFQLTESRPPPKRPQLGAQFHPLVRVHLPQPDRAPPDIRRAQNPVAIESKMRIPGVGSWIEQPNDKARVRINRGKIRTFEEAATLTGPGEVGKCISSAMLPCADVVQVERPKRQVILVKAAVLAATAGPSADYLA